jgi:hypothetical protein
MSQTLPTPEFANAQDAHDWMLAEVDDPCVDNYRFAYNDDEKAIATYNEIQNRGCCGSFDREVRIAGRLATIGCNYGH